MNMCQHAEQILQYAEDVKTYFEPWKLWQFRKKGSDAKWQDVEAHPQWTYYNEYRRKPKMCYVRLASGEVVSWPEPLKEALDIDEEYWYFDASPEGINYDYWKNLDFDKGLLSAGMLHLTKKAAEQHYAAIRKINTQGRDDG